MNKGTSDEAADAAAHTYLLTYDGSMKYFASESTYIIPLYIWKISLFNFVFVRWGVPYSCGNLDRHRSTCDARGLKL